MTTDMVSELRETAGVMAAATAEIERLRELNRRLTLSLAETAERLTQAERERDGLRGSGAAAVVTAACAFVGHYLETGHGGSGAYDDWVRLKGAVAAYGKDGGADRHRLTLAVVEAARVWKEANDARDRDWGQLVAEDRYEEWSESRAGRHAKALADAEKALAAAVAALGKGGGS